MNVIYKRVLATLIALVVCVSTVPCVFAASIRGDANFDGKTNASDALLILKYSVGKKVDNYDKYLFDVNGDYVTNSTDALRVLQMTVGKDNPLGYARKEILKFYSDALYTSYIETTSVEYSSYLSYKIGRWVNANNYDSYPVSNNENITYKFKNGKDEKGKTPYDYFVSPWIYDDACSDVMITRNTTGYEVVIQLKDELITPYENSELKSITPYTGFEFEFGKKGVDEVWGQGEMLNLNYGMITAQINFAGYVEEVDFRVPFNGNMLLASSQTTEKIAVDIADGEYEMSLDFSF